MTQTSQHISQQQHQASQKSPTASPILGKSLIDQVFSQDEIQETTRQLIGIQENIPDPNMPNCLPRLLSFDIRKDSISQFLQLLTNILTYQNKQIDDMKDNMKKRSSDGKIGDLFNQIAGAIPSESLGMQQYARTRCQHRFDDQELGMIGLGIHSEYQVLREGVEYLQESMSKLGKTFVGVMDKQNQIAQKIEIHAKQIGNKFDAEPLREKLKKRKLKFNNSLQDTKENLQNQINNSKENFLQVQTQLRRRMLEVEQNTLWKINDCHQMLKQRPTEQFMHQTLRIQEQALQRDLGGRIHSLEVNFGRFQEDTRKKVEKLEDETKSKLTDFKETIKKVTFKLEKKTDLQKFNQLSTKVQRFKLNYNEQIGVISSTFKKHDNDINELYKLCKSNRQRIIQMQAEYKAMLSEKFVQLDRFLELQTIVTGQTLRLEDIQQICNKVKLQYDNLAPVFQQIDNDMANKVNRDEVKDLLDSNILNEKIQKLISREADKIWDQIQANLRALENKFGRLNLDADFRALQRAMKQKANLDQMQRQFSNNDFRFQSLEGVQQQVNEEMQLFAQCIQNLQKAIQKIKIIPTQMLAGAKGFTCLSCGRNEYGQIVMKSQNSPTQQQAMRKQHFEEYMSGTGKQISGLPQLSSSVNLPGMPMSGGTMGQFAGNLQNKLQSSIGMPHFEMQQSNSSGGLLSMKQNIRKEKIRASSRIQKSIQGLRNDDLLNQQKKLQQQTSQQELPPLNSGRRTGEKMAPIGIKSGLLRSNSIELNQKEGKKIVQLKDQNK